MIKINEHREKMESIKAQAEHSKGRKRKELLKCYHRMRKQLQTCNTFMRGVEKC